MRLGIALYFVELTTDSYFHWALVVTRENEWHAGFVDIYELLRDPSNRSAYCLSHMNASLVNSNCFRGVVDLLGVPEPDGPQVRRMVIAAIMDHPATGRKNRQIRGPVTWTCAAWVLDVLYTLDEQGLWDAPYGMTLDTVYDAVIAIGYRFVVLHDTRATLPGPYPVQRLAFMS